MIIACLDLPQTSNSPISSCSATNAPGNVLPASEYALPPSSASSMAKAAREDGIEAVAIVTPNHLHYPAAKAFLAAGIHVICDKPLTSTLEDARSLVDLVEQSGN